MAGYKVALQNFFVRSGVFDKDKDLLLIFTPFFNFYYQLIIKKRWLEKDILDAYFNGKGKI